MDIMTRMAIIRTALNDRNLKVVAERVAIHYNTLRNFKNGSNDVSMKTINELEKYLLAAVKFTNDNIDGGLNNNIDGEINGGAND